MIAGAVACRESRSHGWRTCELRREFETGLTVVTLPGMTGGGMLSNVSGGFVLNPNEHLKENV